MDYKNVKIAPSASRKKIFSGQENADKRIEPENNPTLRIHYDDAAGQDMPDVMRPREGSKYRYIRPLGRGGMKVVLEVHDNDTMRNVAMVRLSAGEEYRVILFTIDNDSFMESSQVLLLNGFKKKSVKDYKTQIAVANRILNTLECED